MQALTFGQWWDELLVVAVRLDWPVEPDDGSAWESYYDDGYTPEEAIQEDMSYCL